MANSTKSTRPDTGKLSQYISATLLSLAVLIIAGLIVFFIFAPLLHWIGSLVWDSSTHAFPKLSIWWKNIVGTKEFPIYPGSVIEGTLIPVIKYLISIQILLSFCHFKSFSLKSFEVTQAEFLASRIATTGNGTGLEVYLKKVGVSYKKGASNTLKENTTGLIPIFVFHPDKVPISIRSSEFLVNTLDKDGNPVLFLLRRAGRIVDPLVVYEFGGLTEFEDQINRQLGSAISSYIVQHNGYYMKETEDGRMSVHINQDIFEPNRLKIETLIKENPFFEVKIGPQYEGQEKYYYYYLVERKQVYEFQEFVVVDTKINERLAKAFQNLQVKQIDASGEHFKGKWQAAIATVLKDSLPNMDENVAADIAAEAMGSKKNRVIYVTADTYVDGGNSIPTSIMTKNRN